MNKCLTKPLSAFSEVSGCLVEKPNCEYCQQLGFSIICLHPDHASFHAHRAGSMTINEINDRYNTLREKRRNEFMASLDEESRRYLCQKVDFRGRPLTKNSGDR